MISLLRAFYDPSAVLPTPGFYSQLLDEIDTFFIEPQVYRFLQERKQWGEVSEEVRQSLKSKYDTFLYQNMMIRSTEDMIMKELEKRQIEVIPLKGTRFAERFFGHIGARPTSDVDILVKPAHVDTTIELLQQMGFLFDKKIHNHAVLYLNKPQFANPLSIEVHWALEKKYWSDLDHDLFWNASTPLKESPYIRQLSLEHTFYFICLHGVRHRMDSLKYILDIAQIIYRHGHEMNWNEIYQQAIRDRTLRRIQAVISITLQQIPTLRAYIDYPFPLHNTHWSYPMVLNWQRGKKGYEHWRYRLFFKFAIFDTWRHRVLAQKQFYNILMKRKS